MGSQSYFILGELELFHSRMAGFLARREELWELREGLLEHLNVSVLKRNRFVFVHQTESFLDFGLAPIPIHPHPPDPPVRTDSR